MASQVAAVEPSEGQGGIEDRLVRIWSEFLDVESIGPDDNFYTLGGDSLLEFQVVLEMRNVFSVELKLGDIQKNPTVATFAALLRERTGAAA